MHHDLPEQEVSKDVFLEKYAKNGETTQNENRRRIAKALASIEKEPEKYEEIFYQAQVNGFVPAGRIASAAGTNTHSILINCFVQGVGDSITKPDNGYPSIYTALQEAAETMRRGGGVGYDFSRIRPKHAYVKGTDSEASGPLSYMAVFDKSCVTVESAGCFTGDTLINTTDGLIPIKDIVESDKEFYAITHLGPKKITTKFKTGIKKIIQINTKYGFSVKVTEDHKFAQLENGVIRTVPLKDILNSHDLSVLLSVPVANELINDYNNDDALFAYVIGAFHGNGSWRKNDIGKIKGISFSYNVTKLDIAEYVGLIMSRLGFKSNINKRPFENTITIDIYNTNFFSKFEEYGITKDDMQIPKYILEGSADIQASYIAGLYDADGHFSEIKSNIRLRMTSFKLLQQVQVMLARLGVMSKLVLEREAKDNWKRVFNLGIYGNYAQLSFKKTIEKYSLQKLINVSSKDRVGYSHPWEKIQHFDVTKKQFSKYWPGNPEINPNISMRTLLEFTNIPELINTVSDHILSYQHLPEEETYDLEVEDVHLLSGNGIYTSNSRRGAQLSALRCDHPDIFDYIHAKDKEGEFTNFNMSVTVTDTFMIAVQNKQLWKLVHKTKPTEKYIKENQSYYSVDDEVWVWKTIQAEDLWNEIMHSTYDHAEPGILFMDRINNENNLYYCEKIEATNPCAEQPLPPYGCCDLGAMNLTKFVIEPFTNQARFDFQNFERIIPIAVRMLDNVLDVTPWAIDKQKYEAQSKRRIGLGYLGLGDAMVMLGINYNSKEGVEFTKLVTRSLRDASYRGSVELAKEKGAFELFNKEKYLNGNFIKELPEGIRDLISQYGIRNSHLNTCAPTGTITLAFADNASNGIEPPFSWSYDRKKRMQDGSYKIYPVEDHAWRLYRHLNGDIKNLPGQFVTAMEMSVNDHVNIIAAAQEFIDSSVSKTVNIPVDYSYEDFKNVYMRAWELGLKGLATFRPNSITGSVLTVKEEPKKEEIKINIPAIETINDEILESRPKGYLHGITLKDKFHTHEGQCKFLMTINFHRQTIQTENGVLIKERPIEFLLTSNFNTSSSSWAAATRFMSLIGRYNIPVTKMIENLRDITWNEAPIRYGIKLKEGKPVPIWHKSDAAVIGYIIEKMLIDYGYLTEDGKIKQITEHTTVSIEAPKTEHPEPETIVINNGKVCPECGAKAVIRKEGCEECMSCHWKGSCG